MKKLFLYLLKKYTRDEAGRLEVHRVLHDQVSNEYNEQTCYGNVYNGHIEYLMSSPLIYKLTLEEDLIELERVKSGLSGVYNKSITYIKSDILDRRINYVVNFTL